MKSAPFTVTAVDTTLLDLLGRAHDLPVHTLLGGAFRDRTEVHGSVGWDADPNKMAETAVEEAKTYDWLKLYAGRGELDADLDRLQAAIPSQVADLVEAVQTRTPPRRIVFHGHDTWGSASPTPLPRSLRGHRGRRSLGGLGGCLFAPGASGNTSTEDLLFATRPDWFGPGSAGLDGGRHREAARRTR